VLGSALYLVPREHSGLLYGVSITDPTAVAIALFVVGSVAVAASAIPAYRATRVDPIVALRNE
jgi:ABC-type antimicrobial peptide transport system permease subunit